MTTTPAGTMRHVVNIQKDSGAGTYDSLGQTSGSAVTVENGVKCSIENLTGRELELARQVFPLATHRVRMLYRADVNEKYWLLFGTRKLHVGHVENVDELNRELRLLVGEGE